MYYDAEIIELVEDFLAFSPSERLQILLRFAASLAGLGTSGQNPPHGCAEQLPLFRTEALQEIGQFNNFRGPIWRGWNMPSKS